MQLFFVNSVFAITFYIGTNGSDNNSGISESNAWATFSYAISRMDAGDELLVLDGTYYQSISISKSGTGNLPIIIRAKNDGKVIIDGKKNRRPLYISGNYVTIEGMVFKNSSEYVVDITGDHNTLRRCSGYNANPDGNYHIFSIVRNAEHNLLEDCAAGGTGRYCYHIWETRNNTLRRCFGKWGDTNHGSPRAVFAPYAAADNIFENCIGTEVYPHPGFRAQNTYYCVYHEMRTGHNNVLSNNNRFLGCIFFNNLKGGICISSGSGPQIEFINCVFFDHDRTYSGLGNTGYAIAAAGTHRQMIVKNCTFVNHRSSTVWYSGNDAVTNCIFMDNQECFNKSSNHRYCCFYNNETIGGALHSTDIQVDPGFKNGSYIYVPDDSPCKSAGENGEDIGANVVYRYVNGVLTNEPLWPWPMNQRILDELGYDVTGALIPNHNNFPPQALETIINASPLSGPFPLSVNFTSNIRGGTPPYNYSWNFGDGGSSAQQSPNHTYNEIGEYSAILTVTDQDGARVTNSIDIRIINPDILEAIVNATPLSGTIPLTVEFSGNAHGGTSPYIYFWNFGDDITSKQQNPVHIYNQIGSYTALLTVTDNDGQHNTSSIKIDANDPSNVLSINDIKFTLPANSLELTQLQRENWYDFYLYFNTPNGWSEISFAYVWLNGPSYTEGTIENRGGVFHANSSYPMSLSIASGRIWPRQTENSSNGTNVTGSLGLYVDARNNGYEINSNKGWVKVRFKLLTAAESGKWSINAYVKNNSGANSELFGKTFDISTHSDTIPPSPPQHVIVNENN